MFVNFDDNAISLDEYLGNAKEYIDLVVDQSENRNGSTSVEWSRI